MAEAQNLLNQYAGPSLSVQHWLEDRPASHLKRSQASEYGLTISRILETLKFPSALYEATRAAMDTHKGEATYEDLPNALAKVLEIGFNFNATPDSYGKFTYENKEYPSDGTSVVIIYEWAMKSEDIQRHAHIFTLEGYGTQDQKTKAYIRITQTGDSPSVLEYDSEIDAGTDSRGIASPENQLPNPDEYWTKIVPTPRTRHAGKNNDYSAYINVPSDPQAYISTS